MLSERKFKFSASSYLSRERSQRNKTSKTIPYAAGADTLYRAQRGGVIRNIFAITLLLYIPQN